MEVASERSLQLSDGRNQERQAKDSNPAILHTSHKREVHTQKDLTHDALLAVIAFTIVYNSTTTPRAEEHLVSQR